jgi:hypothetical protein
MVIQIAAHCIILMIQTYSCSFHLYGFQVQVLWCEKCTWKLTHTTRNVSRECVTVLYCHICNVKMELSAKHLVTRGAYSEGVLLTVRILGCEKIFLSSVVKYCVWAKNSSDGALEDTVLTWHVQISYFMFTLYTKHLRYSPYRTSLQYRTSSQLATSQQLQVHATHTKNY